VTHFLAFHSLHTILGPAFESFVDEFGCEAHVTLYALLARIAFATTEARFVHITLVCVW
jgi:hypothetical protein